MVGTMTEAELMAAVIDLARLLGWRVHHCRPARTGQGWRTPITGHAGFPDLVLARRGVVIFAELKSERGKVSPDQREWLQALSGDTRVAATRRGPERVRAVGVVDPRVFVWRPADWTNGTIEETLR